MLSQHGKDMFLKIDYYDTVSQRQRQFKSNGEALLCPDTFLPTYAQNIYERFAVKQSKLHVPHVDDCEKLYLYSYS